MCDGLTASASIAVTREVGRTGQWTGRQLFQKLALRDQEKGTYVAVVAARHVAARLAARSRTGRTSRVSCSVGRGELRGGRRVWERVVSGAVSAVGGCREGGLTESVDGHDDIRTNDVSALAIQPQDFTASPWPALRPSLRQRGPRSRIPVSRIRVCPKRAALGPRTARVVPVFAPIRTDEKLPAEH